MSANLQPPLEVVRPISATDRWFSLAAVAVFGLLWLWQVRESEGFLEADACSHLLIARFALDEPFRFVDIWGRPIKTLLYAVPAYFAGRVGVQAVSLLLAVVCAWVARLLARDLGLRSPGLALAMTLGMPLVFLHSFSELTELPFAALLAVAFLAWRRGHFAAAGFLAGMLPLSRPEGFGVLLLAAVALLWGRRWAGVVLLPLGLVAWSLAGWQQYGSDGPWQQLAGTEPLWTKAWVWTVSVATWLPRHWPYAGDSVYPSGSPLHFVALLPALVGPVVFPGLLAGLVVARKWFGRSVPDWRSGVVLLPVFVLVAHSALFAFGKMASNGELRYLLVTAPFWGILTAAGWEAILRRLHWSDGRIQRATALALLIPLVVNLGFYGVLPLRFDNAWETTRFVASFANRLSVKVNRPAVMAAHPGIYYFLDRSNNHPVLSREFKIEYIRHPPPGTLLLYDPMYARFNASRDRRVEGVDEIVAAGWIEWPGFRPGGWRIFLSPQEAPPR
jgi:hypothetical protein